VNSSILFEANGIETRFKKNQLSAPQEVTYVTLLRLPQPQNGMEIAQIYAKMVELMGYSIV
jgi:hypothetical protein